MYFYFIDLINSIKLTRHEPEPSALYQAGMTVSERTNRSLPGRRRRTCFPWSSLSETNSRPAS